MPASNAAVRGADVKDGSLATVDLSSAAQADLAGRRCCDPTGVIEGRAGLVFEPSDDYVSP